MDRLARRAYFNSLTFRQGGRRCLFWGCWPRRLLGVAWRISLKSRTRAGLRERPGADRPADGDGGDGGGRGLASAAALLERSLGRRVAPKAERDLRARLTNAELKPGEVNVCPCRKGTKPEELEGQWPFLRGPSMSGRASFTNAPVAWNGETGQGIAWKTPLVRGGASTPVVWGQRLFLTAGDAKARSVLAYDAADGKLLWSADVPDGSKAAEPLPEVGEEAGFAASTPACDASRVYAVFGTGDLAALGHDGKIVWQVYLGRPKNTYGHASSLAYCGEMLIVQWDQEEKGKILALDKNTGKTLWETPREAGMSWSTPVVMPSCDKPLLLIHASQQTWGLELATGKKLWQVEAVSGEVAPSPAWEGDVWLARTATPRWSRSSSRRRATRRRVGVGGRQPSRRREPGDLGRAGVSGDRRGRGALPQPGGRKEVWHQEFEDGITPRRVAGGKLYVVDRAKGVFRVYATGREAKVLSVNPMATACARRRPCERPHLRARPQEPVVHRRVTRVRGSTVQVHGSAVETFPCQAYG
jgi:hypothetical protein